MMVQDIFALIVRLAGLVMIVFGIFDILHLVMKLTGLPWPSQYTPLVDAVAALVWFVIGFGFLFGARPITRLAYRGE